MRETEVQHIVPAAIAFEASLGLAGWWLAQWSGLPISGQLAITSAALVRGAAATGPLLILLSITSRTSWRPLARLRNRVSEMVRSLFGRAAWYDLALVAAAAGLGEELLFRGALQPLAVNWTTPVIGVAATSLLFGGLHAATAAYFVLATAIGAYLGWLAHGYDDLVAPIIAHGAYDFAALMVLMHDEPTD